MLSLRGFIVLCFTLRSLIHVSLIFIKGRRSLSSFTFWPADGQFPHHFQTYQFLLAKINMWKKHFNLILCLETFSKSSL